MAERYLSYIGGEWVSAEGGEFFENRSPADTNDLIGLFPRSSAADVDRAVQAATGAFRAIRDIEAGITYVNGPTIGAEVRLPFGGVKDAGNGHREASHTVLDTLANGSPYTSITAEGFRRPRSIRVIDSLPARNARRVRS